ncbi:hypothetical protein TorRG33x02_192350 [Trema orientale]|uniref:Uncharacterized protein n=1 Tax=Trema orientale TaxID=63057 RepID=A0A2P5EHJ1_TREOI|nr:hypothetical protein TorRG33x02_192350 [Trema orientale]
METQDRAVNYRGRCIHREMKREVKLMERQQERRKILMFDEERLSRKEDEATLVKLRSKIEVYEQRLDAMKANYYSSPCNSNNYCMVLKPNKRRRVVQVGLELDAMVIDYHAPEADVGDDRLERLNDDADHHHVSVNIGHLVDVISRFRIGNGSAQETTEDQDMHNANEVLEDREVEEALALQLRSLSL